MKKEGLKWIFILTSVFIVQHIQAQTKQEIYCNENIVWAGIGEMDIVIDADTATIWKTYKVSSLGGLYKQYHRDLKHNPKSLNQLVLENVETIDFYYTDRLQEKIDYNMLDLTDPMYEPENFGDQGGRFPADIFEVFRLRYYLYYDKLTNDFQIEPMAVGVMRSVYDAPDEVFDYKLLGWMSVNDWRANFLNDENTSFARRFYRDVPFEDVYVFKQEWSIGRVMDTLTTRLREQADDIELYETNIDSLDGSRKLDIEEINKIGTYENITITEDGWDWVERTEYIPWNADDYYKGLRLTLDWAWNSSSYTFYSELKAYAPLFAIDNDMWETLYLRPLFLKKLSK